MAIEKNLNEMLNSEEIADTGTASTLAKAKKGAASETPATTAPAAGYVSLYDFVNTHKAKISNAAVTNIAGFTRVPTGKFLMFCTNSEADAELVLFERPSTLWIEQTMTPDSIKVEGSGMIIKSNSARYYVGKNNVSKVSITDNKVVGISTISRAKSADSVKVETEEVRIQDVDVDTIKLHAKKVSPRLYNAVKDATTKEEIRSKILDFMNKVFDVNHLLKIEKELLLSLSI